MTLFYDERARRRLISRAVFKPALRFARCFDIVQDVLRLMDFPVYILVVCSIMATDAGGAGEHLHFVNFTVESVSDIVRVRN